MLTSRQNNVACLWHHHDSQTRKNDGFDPKKPYRIAGVPGERTYDKARNPGFLHCGCSEEMGLWQFYIFKTWRVEKGSLVESMVGTRFDPRMREFIVQAFKRTTGLTLDDMYVGSDASWEGPVHQQKLRRLQISYLALDLMRLTEALGGKPGEDAAWFFSLWTNKGIVSPALPEGLTGMETDEDEDKPGTGEAFVPQSSQTVTMVADTAVRAEGAISTEQVERPDDSYIDPLLRQGGQLHNA
jgi:hypothetical protein